MLEQPHALSLCVPQSCFYCAFFVLPDSLYVLPDSHSAFSSSITLFDTLCAFPNKILSLLDIESRRLHTKLLPTPSSILGILNTSLSI